MPPSANSILDRPVLIVGAPRSGTTWVQRLLLAHPAFAGGQESEFFTHFTPPLRVFQNAGTRHRFIGLDNYWTGDALRQEIIALWRKTMSPMLKDSTTVLVEKSPDHALCMTDIHALLPEAKFIHVIRDSRAVCASLMAAAGEKWGKGWTPTRPQDAAARWRRSVRTARAAGKEMGPDFYQEVFYEDLIADGVPYVRQLFEFAGVPVAESQLHRIVDEQKFEKQKAIGGTPFQRAGEVANKGEAAAKEPTGFFRKGQAEGWKQELSIWEQLVIWRHTRHLMRELGYSWNGRAHIAPPTPNRPTPPTPIIRSAAA